MKLGRLIQFALIAAAVLMLAGIASASTISFTTALSTPTNPYTTQFGSGGVILSSTGGTAGVGAATITFSGNTATDIGVPSNVNFGDFLLRCAACSTAAQATASATFGSFTADLYVWDQTDNAYGEFIGTSTGGLVYSDQSTVNILWSPELQIGPGTSNAIAGGSGSFGPTFFVINSQTGIVAPNSGAGGGASAGDTTIGGSVNSTLVPEPTTMALVGGLFVGLAALGRKRRK